MRHQRILACVVIVLAAAVCGFAIPTQKGEITWNDADVAGSETCSNTDCLLAEMRKNGASGAAVDFARRLTALRNGVPSWATKVVLPGKVSVVAYDCVGCKGAHFAIVNDSGTGVPMVDQRAMFPAVVERQLGLYRAANANHAYAVLTDAGDAFLGVVPLPQGGTRYEFVHMVADCSLCHPLIALKYALDFGAKMNGVKPHMEGLVPLSSIQHAIAARGPRVMLVLAEKDGADYEIQIVKLSVGVANCGDPHVRLRQEVSSTDAKRGGIPLTDGEYCVRRAAIPFVYTGPIATKSPSPEFDAFVKARHEYESTRTWTAWSRFTVKTNDQTVVVR